MVFGNFLRLTRKTETEPRHWKSYFMACLKTSGDKQVFYLFLHDNICLSIVEKTEKENSILHKISDALLVIF